LHAFAIHKQGLTKNWLCLVVHVFFAQPSALRHEGLHLLSALFFYGQGGRATGQNAESKLGDQSH
jgi:hypothetical protein